MLREIAPDIPVLFLDTVHHFPQTIAYRDELADAMGAESRHAAGGGAAARTVAAGHQGLLRHGTRSSPSSARSTSYDVWFTGLRRAQSASRADARGDRALQAANGHGAAQGEPARALVDQGSLELREGPRHSAAAALRPRLHQRRLRAVHDAARRSLATSGRAAGRVRSWNAASTSRSRASADRPAPQIRGRNRSYINVGAGPIAGQS